MKKRGISILLALLLIVSLLPGAAFAQNGGTVRVIAENRTFTEPVDGVTPAWTGTLFDETVARTDGMTMMDALEAAAGQAGQAVTIVTSSYGAYLSGIAGLNAGDYPRKTGEWNMSGWLGSLNGKFPSAGMDTVAVADGDVVCVQYTCDGTHTDPPHTAPEHVCAQYTDLKNDWARAGICYAIDHGIMTGTATNVFSPDLPMSRAMLVTMLWRVASSPAAAAADFPDVAGGTWYTDAVAWAQETGIVDGYPDGTFAPMKAVSREELATILHRYAEKAGMDVTASNDLSAFTDRASVQPYALTAMQWAVGSSLVTGVSPTELDAQGTATRAQSAVILWRLLDTDTALKAAAHHLLTSVPAPTYGDEWIVLDMARGNVTTPPAYAGYYAQVEAKVKETGGVLSDRYYTEYARVALAVTAIGKDATDVAGYDLIAPLTDVDKVASQGVNGVIYALLALDSGSYEADVRAQYVEKILAAQLPGGGFTYMEGDPADPDLTAIALQALDPYRADAQVSAAVDRALNCLSAMQQADGGFVSWGASSAESTAQAILALCTLGIDLQDSRFVKDGHSLLDNLMTFQLANGGFCHTADGGYNAPATEQALRALVAAQRAAAGDTALYQIR